MTVTPWKEESWWGHSCHDVHGRWLMVRNLRELLLVDRKTETMPCHPWKRLNISLQRFRLPSSSGQVHMGGAGSSLGGRPVLSSKTFPLWLITSLCESEPTVRTRVEFDLCAVCSDFTQEKPVWNPARLTNAWPPSWSSLILAISLSRFWGPSHFCHMPPGSNMSSHHCSSFADKLMDRWCLLGCLENPNGVFLNFFPARVFKLFCFVFLFFVLSVPKSHLPNPDPVPNSYGVFST